MRTSRIELQEVAIRALPTRTDGKHLGVRTRKCQNCPVRETQTGQFWALSANSRRLSGTAKGHLVVAPR